MQVPSLTDPIATPAIISGWQATTLPSGSTSLRVAGMDRRYPARVFGAISALWTWELLSHALAHKPMPLDADPIVAGLLEALLLALALWCAFADQSWTLAPNLLESRVGFTRAARVRRFQDAQLRIVYRTSARWNVPYCQLYADVDGRANFLMDGRPDDVRTLASFIAERTGWPLR